MSYSDEQKQPEPGRCYMKLKGNRRMYLDRPDPMVFDPRLDAEALACENRYAGQYGPYSVAQHSVLVANTVMRLGGSVYEQHGALWHEASEAVTGDVPQPVKSQAPDFKALERRIQAAADRRYDINSSAEVIKEADRIVFCAEIRRLVPRDEWDAYGEYGFAMYRAVYQPSARDLIIWSPDHAAKEMVAMHEMFEEMRSKL